MKNHVFTLTGLTALSGLMLAGCGGDPLEDEPAEDTDAPDTEVDGDEGDAGTDGLTVGSADFPESQILASIYSTALDDAGIDVSENLNIGSREVYIAAIEDGSIDLVPEYAGALMMHFDSDSEATETDEVLETLEEVLPGGLTALEASEAQNRNELVVRQETADEYGLSTYSDIEPVGPELTIGGPPEWQERFNGLVGLEEVYGIEFADFLTLDAGGPLSLESLVNGQVEMTTLFSTDPQIEENDLVVLDDDEALFAAENILPVISTDHLSDDVEEVLNGISEALTTEDLMEMNERAGDGDDLSEIAQDWLEEEGLI